MVPDEQYPDVKRTHLFRSFAVSTCVHHSLVAQISFLPAHVITPAIK